jgi:hypothetical protein
MDAGAYVYDNYPEDEVAEVTDQELMEIDGLLLARMGGMPIQY